jgi:hypothetical protein
MIAFPGLKFIACPDYERCYRGLDLSGFAGGRRCVSKI